MKTSILERLALPEIRELITNKEFETLRQVLSRWEPADVAPLISDLDSDERTWLFRALEERGACSAFEYLDAEVQEQLVESLPSHELSKILNGMAPDDRTLLLENLPTERTQRLLSLLSVDERRIAESLLAYPEDRIGRFMTPDYIAVKERWSVAQVFEYVRAYGKDSETLNVVYVTGERGTLVDDIRMRELLLASRQATVADLMDRKFVALQVLQPKQEAVEVFQRYDRTALPVVNEAGILVGIVTVDDVLDLAEKEATRDIQQLGGSEALEDPYITTPLPVMISKRASWLVVLFLGEMLTATAMGFFEGEIQRAVVLALFVPLIISSGGNSGSQAATLLVRALALKEIQVRDWMTVCRRELISGLCLGLILGTIGFLRIALWSMFSGLYGTHWVLVGMTVSVALVGVVLWGTFAGSMLPFLLVRLRFDPARSSAPLVATLVDVTGLVIYFTVALLLLRGTLL